MGKQTRSVLLLLVAALAVNACDLACIIHELLHESSFSFSCVDSKDKLTSRIRFAGAVAVESLQTALYGRCG